MDEPIRKPGTGKPDKTERLAEALRENLRKRKAQARARRGGGATKTDTPGSGNGSGDEG